MGVTPDLFASLEGVLKLTALAFLWYRIQWCLRQNTFLHFIKHRSLLSLSGKYLQRAIQQICKLFNQTECFDIIRDVCISLFTGFWLEIYDFLHGFMAFVSNWMEVSHVNTTALINGNNQVYSLSSLFTVRVVYLHWQVHIWQLTMGNWPSSSSNACQKQEWCLRLYHQQSFPSIAPYRCLVNVRVFPLIVSPYKCM